MVSNLNSEAHAEVTVGSLAVPLGRFPCLRPAPYPRSEHPPLEVLGQLRVIPLPCRTREGASQSKLRLIRPPLVVLEVSLCDHQSMQLRGINESQAGKRRAWSDCRAVHARQRKFPVRAFHELLFLNGGRRFYTSATRGAPALNTRLRLPQILGSTNYGRLELEY